MFGESYSDLIRFINHYLPKEVEGVITATVIRKILTKTGPDGMVRWSVEVACDDRMDRGGEKRKELQDTVSSLIRFYGENCDDVIINRVYIDKERYLSL